MRPCLISLLLIILLVERINGFGFLGFGGSAVKETSTSADILKNKLVNKVLIIQLFFLQKYPVNMHLNNKT